MWRGLINISLTIMLTASAFPADAKKRAAAVQPYLETKINRPRVVEGEKLIYEVVLHTPDPNIAGIELYGNPSFDNLSVSRSAADNHWEEIDSDGKRWFTIVVDRFFINADRRGKYLLRGGSYGVGVNRQYAMEDPFWGPYMAQKVEILNLEAPDLKISVDPLPKKGRPEDFSGAIGNFSINIEIPPGDIHEEDDVYAIITISGEGDLSEASLPDVRSIFTEELTFRSMTENRNHFVRKGEIGSEIEIECMFTPKKEGTLSLVQCSFSYYNPETRKYERSFSDKLEVKVLPSQNSDGASPQYMDI